MPDSVSPAGNLACGNHCFVSGAEADACGVVGAHTSRSEDLDDGWRATQPFMLPSRLNEESKDAVQ